MINILSSSQWRIKELTDVEGAPIFAKKYNTLAVTYGSGGMLPRNFFKSKASNDTFQTIFRPKYGRFFVFWDTERGDARRLRPLWIRHWLFPLHLHTYVMGPYDHYKYLTLTVRGSTLDVIIWRLWTSDNGVESRPSAKGLEN